MVGCRNSQYNHSSSRIIPYEHVSRKRGDEKNQERSPSFAPSEVRISLEAMFARLSKQSSCVSSSEVRASLQAKFVRLSKQSSHVSPSEVRGSLAAIHERSYSPIQLFGIIISRRRRRICVRFRLSPSDALAKEGRDDNRVLIATSAYSATHRGEAAARQISCHGIALTALTFWSCDPP